MKRRPPKILPSIKDRARARALLANPSGPPSLFVSFGREPERATIGDKSIRRRQNETMPEFERRVVDELTLGKSSLVIFEP